LQSAVFSAATPAEIEPRGVLIVTRLDRLARSTRDLLNVLDAVAKAKTGLTGWLEYYRSRGK
jgi:hypothetical protein